MSFTDEKPKLLEVLDIDIDRTGPGKLVVIQAYGTQVRFNFDAAIASHYGNFSILAESTFQDALDGGPICSSMNVARWKPQDQKFLPSEDARVDLSEAKALTLHDKRVLSRQFREMNLDYPLVRNVRRIGINPDGEDLYLVSYRNLKILPEKVRYFWTLCEDDGRLTPVIAKYEL